MYEVTFETESNYIITELHADDTEIRYDNTLSDNQTDIILYTYNGKKGVAVSSLNNGGVTNSFIPLPEDLVSDIREYMENGIVEDHAFSSEVVLPPNRVANVAAADPENPNVANNGNPLPVSGGARRRYRRSRKTMRKRRVSRRHRRN